MRSLCEDQALQPPSRWASLCCCQALRAGAPCLPPAVPEWRAQRCGMVDEGSRPLPLSLPRVLLATDATGGRLANKGKSLGWARTFLAWLPAWPFLKIPTCTLGPAWSIK